MTVKAPFSFKQSLLLSALLPALLLGACGQSNLPTSASSPAGSPASSVTSAAPVAQMPAKASVTGELYAVTFTDAGNGQLTSTISVVRDNKLVAQDLVEVPSGLTFATQTNSAYVVGNTRYLQLAYRVSNGTGRDLTNLAVVPMNLDDTDGNAANNAKPPSVTNTPFANVFLGSGAAAPDATVEQIGTTQMRDSSGNLVSGYGTYVTDPQYASVVLSPPAGLSNAPLGARWSGGAWQLGNVASGGSTPLTMAIAVPYNSASATAKQDSVTKFTIYFSAVSDAMPAADQKAIAFTPGVHPVADPADPNWLGQAVVRSGTTDYLAFKTYSANATAMRVELHDAAAGGRDSTLQMTKDSATNIWYAAVPLAAVRAPNVATPVPTTGLFASDLSYGFRAWGPNWPTSAAWTPGSSAGFISDVDSAGNRFNPNKLLLDPYGLEITHDYVTANNMDVAARYTSGATNRNTDTASFAPRSYVALTRNADWSTLSTQVTHPATPQKDDIIYEVHVRGLTRQDGGVTATLQGTYAGAAQKAQYLKSLGVTAVEFLPVQETENDGNDGTSATRSPTSTEGDNYWGYMTTNFFAPDRRYSSDQTAGGPTREFAAMTKAFKDAGIKVVTDVVYNHTGEGGAWSSTDNTQANLWSFRGLDNSTYYLLTNTKQDNYDITGTGNTMNTRNPQVQKLIIDSLKYQRNLLGVDGFRFDLGIALGNTYDNTTNSSDSQRFYFSGTDSNTALAKVAQAFPNVFLSAEPWGLAPNGQGYQIGKFPTGWSEWNGQFRDYFRRAQNLLDTTRSDKTVTPGMLASRFAGSSDLFQGSAHNNRSPYNSVNFINVHDGMTLKDVYSCNGKWNTQAWPFGPSDGGTSDEDSWDNWTANADNTNQYASLQSAPSQAQQQRQQARNGMAFLAISQGVPIFNGGDEFLRSLNCNNNPYNLDSSGNWLNWTLTTDQQNFQAYTRAALNFRLAHPALRRADFFTGTDNNGNGYKDITWFKADGSQPDSNFFNNTGEHALAFLVDGTEQNDAMIYTAYNAWKGDVTFNLPTLPSGYKWYRVTDTAWWGEGTSQFDSAASTSVSNAGGGGSYGMKGRSVLILIAKPN